MPVVMLTVEPGACTRIGYTHTISACCDNSADEVSILVLNQPALEGNQFQFPWVVSGSVAVGSTVEEGGGLQEETG